MKSKAKLPPIVVDELAAVLAPASATVVAPSAPSSSQHSAAAQLAASLAHEAPEIATWLVVVQSKPAPLAASEHKAFLQHSASVQAAAAHAVESGCATLSVA